MCPDSTPWECQDGAVGMCTRSCREEQNVEVEPPTDGGTPDKRTGAKGAAVVDDTKSMHLGKAGFAVEGWVRIPSTPMIKQDHAVGASYIPDETWIDTEETIQCSANVVNDIMGNLKDMAMSKVDSAVGGLVDGLKNSGVPAEVTLSLSSNPKSGPQPRARTKC